MVRTSVFVSLAVVAVASTASAQPPPPPPPPPPPLSGMSVTMAEDLAPPVGTSVLSGVVTDGATGAPVAGALVALVSATPGGTMRPRQMTDSRGRYAFTHLPAGGYFVSAARPGYLDGGYRRPPGVTSGVRITLTEGEWFPGADVRLWKPATIGGVVTDERGDPLVGIPVRLLTRAPVLGAERWVAGPATTTDDRGVYRVANLLPGRYLVHVPGVQVTLPSGQVSLYGARPTTPAGPTAGVAQDGPDIIRGADGRGIIIGHGALPGMSGRGSAYPMTFHPAAHTLDLAEAISVDFGDERMDADVQMRPVATVSVSGRVVGPAESIADLPVRLVPRGAEGLGLGMEAGLTRTDAGGAFTFHLIPSGDYTVLASRSVSEYSQSGALGTMTLVPRAANTFIVRSSSTQVIGTDGLSLRTQGAAGPHAMGQTPVSVGTSPVEGLVLTLMPAQRVSGHIEWDGSETPPEGVIPPTIRLEPADGNVELGLHFSLGQRPAAGQPPTRMTFTIDTVPPGEYVLGRVLAGTGWTLAGAEWNGRDVLSSPIPVTADRPVDDLVIRMTTQRNSLAGSVRGPAGPAASGGVVIVFPAAQAARRAAGISGTRFASTPILPDGTYNLGGLLPGEYLLAAIPQEDRRRWTDPEFLDAIAAQATRITVTPSSTLTRDLHLIGGGR